MPEAKKTKAPKKAKATQAASKLEYLTVVVPPGTTKDIDGVRGETSRSRWVRDLVEAALGRAEKRKAKAKGKAKGDEAEPEPASEAEPEPEPELAPETNPEPEPDPQ